MAAFEWTPTFGQNGALGATPELWVGVDLPDGDAWPFNEAPVGSIFCYKPSETAAPKHFTKRSSNDRDDDWMVLGGVHCIHQFVEFGDFTDGGSTSGTLALTETIPVGAVVDRAWIRNLTGFTGDTSATITIGDGTDVDRYNTGTPSVFTTAAILDVGVPSGVDEHTAAKTVTLTITSNSDWGLVTAGSMSVDIYYFA